MWYKRHYLVPLHGVSTAVLPLLKFQPSYLVEELNERLLCVEWEVCVGMKAVFCVGFCFPENRFKARENKIRVATAPRLCALAKFMLGCVEQ